jgi:hypothetical protein
MKKHLTISVIFVMQISIGILNAQNYTQTIKGQVLDKQSQQPLPGANAIVVGSNPVIGSTSDINGYFKLTGVPVGRVTISVSFLGYQTATISNVILSSGKEVVLSVDLEEKITTTEEVVVKATKSKTQANNEMATISARSFTVEETEKYAGSRGDVARMASNYAGVSFANDSRNDIVIRGNSPSGLLWKLEDVEIPNPNHFAENGTTGGPVGMLNNNVLKNSDFFTGAFPAEYGNALSGVFDLKMRNGNTEKYEFTGQCGFNGFEVGAEGPIRKNNNSSFMAFYRYSTLEVMDKMGVSVGTSGVPKYQDLSFKFNYPTSKGVITLFGLRGNSSIDMLDSKVSKSDMYNVSGQNLYSHASMAASGLSYTHFVDKKTFIKVSLSGLSQDGGTNIDTLAIAYDVKNNTGGKIDTNYYYSNSATRVIQHDISEYRASMSFLANTKHNSKLTTKLGFSVDQMGYKLNTKSYIDSLNGLFQVMSGEKKLTDGPKLYRSYVEANYKLTDEFTFNPGVQFVYFDLSKQKLFEPRAGLSWSYSNNRKISLAYGLHSRTQALSTYYKGAFMPDHSLILTNINLGATRSHQFVLGHDWNISNNLRLKTETYYQYLFDVPVERKLSSYSILNTGAYWGSDANDSLVNKGTGYNYGLEITFEKFFSNNYYFLITTSLFDSKYKASDDTLRNTMFNGNYVINALAGYEHPLSKKWTLALDIKLAYAGGKRYMPIDVNKSKNSDETEYLDYDVFKNKLPDFLKLDFKLTIRQNNPRFTQEWQIYIENITNHKNVLNQSFNKIKPTESAEQRMNHKFVTYDYQLGFFPMVNYRILF